MINFSRASVLSYNQRNDFLGDAFRYASKRDLTIDGIIESVDAIGVHSIWEQMSGLIEGAVDYDDILINGISFGSGRVNSFQFKEGVDVKYKNYSANITVFDTGNLFNMTGPYYDGLDLTNSDNPVHLLENFNENFDFYIKEDGTYGYKQAVNLKFISGKLAGNNRSAIDMAKGFASGLLFSSPAFGFIDSAHSGFYTVDGVRTYTESYNLITNECSFSENFELPGSLSGTYSYKYNHEIATDQYGSTNITEHGSIKGIFPDFYTNAEAGYTAQAPYIFDRCSGVLDYYVPSGFPLKNSHVASSKRVNKILGQVDYSLSFTNNPSYNPLYVLEYVSEISRGADKCTYKVAERGRIKGLDDCMNSIKMQNAQSAYSVVRTGIISRIEDFYADATSLSNTLKPVSLSKKDSPLVGQIEYNFVFTDDLNYHVAPSIKRIDYSIEDSRPVDKYNRFNIIGVAEIMQSARIATEGTYTINAKIVGERGTALDICLNEARQIALDHQPTGEDRIGTSFITNCTYSFVPYESTLNFNITWKYLGDVTSILG